MIKNFLSSIVVSLFLILLVILCSENDKEESRHEPQNTWFYTPTGYPFRAANIAATIMIATPVRIPGR